MARRCNAYAASSQRPRGASAPPRPLRERAARPRTNHRPVRGRGRNPSPNTSPCRGEVAAPKARRVGASAWRHGRHVEFFFGAHNSTPRPLSATLPLQGRVKQNNLVLAAPRRPSFAVSSHVERESRACEPKQSGGSLFFRSRHPIRQINQGSGTPTDACSLSASFDAAPPSERPPLFEGGTERGSPVGVPPRFLPEGVVVPKAQLQAKASCNSAGASGPVSAP